MSDNDASKTPSSAGVSDGANDADVVLDNDNHSRKYSDSDSGLSSRRNSESEVDNRKHANGHVFQREAADEPLDCLSNTSYTQSKGFQVVFKDVSVSFGDRQILTNVCGKASPGKLLAVMGPSGSGKTTLLNLLGGRLSMESGSIAINGRPLNKAIRRKICYVLQDDVFFPNLTLRETLLYTALLRLPQSMSYKSKVKRVEDIIDVLDMRKCTNTIMGGTFVRGLSGGERKRTNIASELLTNPSLLLLDEPTSGLDSSTAYQLMVTLSKYSKTSLKTVITTIHQPSSQIFHMFDSLLLMCNGQVAYYGPGNGILDFFADLGLHCQPHYNPADFILEKVKEGKEIEDKIVAAQYAFRQTKGWPVELQSHKAYDSETTLLQKGEINSAFVVDETSQVANGDVSENVSNDPDPHKIGTPKRIHSVCEEENGVSGLGYSKRDPDSVEVTVVSYHQKDIDTEEAKVSKWPTGFIFQYWVLTLRTFKQSRHRILSKLNIIQSLVMALYCGLVWFQLPREEATIDDRMGILFFSNVYWGFVPLLDAISAFIEEKAVINKERASGAYRLSAYYFAKMTSELPLYLSMPLIFTTIVYWMAGLNNVASYFAMIGFILLSSLSVQGVGIFIGVTIEDFKTAITVASVYMLSTMLVGGFYQRNIPVWLEWIKYLSIINYSFHASMLLEFSNAPPLGCAPANQTRFPECMVNGTTSFESHRVLEEYKVTWPLWLYAICICAFFVVFRLAGYLVLRFYRRPKSAK